MPPHGEDDPHDDQSAQGDPALTATGIVPLSPRPRRSAAGFVLGVVVVLLAGYAGFHEQTAELTLGEIIFGGGLALLAVGGWLGLLLTTAPLGAPVRWAIALATWEATNLAIAYSNGVSPNEWLRLAFPQLVFPSFIVVGWLAAPTDRVRTRLLTMVTVMGAAVIIGSMLAVRSISLTDITDLQLIRRFGGDFYAPFTATLAGVTLLSAHGRRSQPLGLTLSLLVVGLVGLALSFTRTYWASTAVALVGTLALMWRVRHRDFRLAIILLPVTAAILFTFALLFLPRNIVSLLETRLYDLGNVGNVESFQERILESRAALSTQLENPLSLVVGSGFGAEFGYEYVHPRSGVVYGGHGLKYIHNFYVYLIFTQGLVGLGIFLGLWMALARDIYRNLRLADAEGPPIAHVYLGAAAAAVNLLVANLTTPQFENFQWPMTFGLLVALGARAPTELTELTMQPRPAAATANPGRRAPHD